MSGNINPRKLELTWIGKENRPRLEPRILLEDPELSYHAKHRVSDGDIFDNMLIHGDNLLALKALEAEYAGKVKCVFIDPPYNTGSAFEHYDDGLEHSIWLSMMRDRLEIIRRLMSEDGSLWITIDDNEAHYLKVLCDEVFGRANFVATVIWERTTSSRNDAGLISIDHDYILVLARSKEQCKLNGLPRTVASEAAYSNPDNDPRGPWREGDYKVPKSATERPNLYYPIKHPVTGEDVWPRRERVWAYSQQEHQRHVKEDLLWWGKTGNYRLPKLKRFRSAAPERLVPRTLWKAEDVSQSRTAAQELRALFPGTVTFATPKPERLLARVLELSTNPGDLVLDTFAGSGTTGAVAQKLRRRWIMAELGGAAESTIVPRLRKVIDGEDPGGITKAVDWKGGGGFRYYRLAPSLLEKDRWGQWVISKQYNAAMLSEAICKLEGFAYAPSDALYWQHGHSTERDYVYVTTQTLTHDQLMQLNEEVGPDRALLVMCSAFRGHVDAYPNLTVKKIPNTVLSRCEWGHDDYSLRVENLPKAPEPEGQRSLFELEGAG